MALGAESTFSCWSATELTWPVATGSGSGRLSSRGVAFPLLSQQCPCQALVSLASPLGWLPASQLISPGMWTSASDRKG